MNIKNFSEGTVIQCDTEEKAKLLLNTLRKQGYKWVAGGDVTLWEVYEDETCYFIKNNEINFHAKASLKNLSFFCNTCKIVSFDDLNFIIPENEKSYEDGCQEMQKAIQFVYYEAECNEQKTQKFISCFGEDASFERILIEYPGVKLIERLEEYDKNQSRIKPSDEVFCFADTVESYGVVLEAFEDTNVYQVLMKNGKVKAFSKQFLEKTGRTIDLPLILSQIRQN